jgi:hypothetical protein
VIPSRTERITASKRRSAAMSWLRPLIVMWRCSWNATLSRAFPHPPASSFPAGVAAMAASGIQAGVADAAMAGS